MLVSCVPIRAHKKNDEKGYFFELGSAHRCHRLGEKKNAIILVEKVFYNNLYVVIRGGGATSQIHHYFLISQNIIKSFRHLVLK